MAYMLLYMDYIMFIASSFVLLHQIITILCSEFSIADLSSLSYFLCITVTRNRHNMFLSQQKYSTVTLERAKMLNFRAYHTLLDTFAKFDGTGPPVTDLNLYPSLVASLQYLAFTRIDITYVAYRSIYIHMILKSLTSWLLIVFSVTFEALFIIDYSYMLLVLVV